MSLRIIGNPLVESSAKAVAVVPGCTFAVRPFSVNRTTTKTSASAATAEAMRRSGALRGGGDLGVARRALLIGMLPEGHTRSGGLYTLFNRCRLRLWLRLCLRWRRWLAVARLLRLPVAGLAGYDALSSDCRAAPDLRPPERIYRGSGSCGASLGSPSISGASATGAATEGALRRRCQEALPQMLLLPSFPAAVPQNECAQIPGGHGSRDCRRPVASKPKSAR